MPADVMLSLMVFPASGLATGQTLFSAMRVNHRGVHTGKRRCREVEFPRGGQRLWVIQTCRPQVHTGDASADAHTVASFFEEIPCLSGSCSSVNPSLRGPADGCRCCPSAGSVATDPAPGLDGGRLMLKRGPFGVHN